MLQRQQSFPCWTCYANTSVNVYYFRQSRLLQKQGLLSVILKVEKLTATCSETNAHFTPTPYVSVLLSKKIGECVLEHSGFIISRADYKQRSLNWILILVTFLEKNIEKKQNFSLSNLAPKPKCSTYLYGTCIKQGHYHLNNSSQQHTGGEKKVLD